MTEDENEWGPELICMFIIIPGLCIVGLLGNILTLAVLTCRLKDGIETIEKGSLAGMMALAISDFFFSFITIAQVLLIDDSLIYRSWTPTLYITMYANYFQNLFIKISTYITVVMALYRYIALVYPMIACKYMNHIVMYKLIAIIVGCAFWLFFLLPLLWLWDTIELNCGNGQHFIILKQGIYMQNQTLYKTFTFLYLLFGFLVPLCVLLYCNTGIIRALHRTRRKTRSQYQSSRNHRPNTQRRTSITLVSIVICFYFFVSPSETLDLYEKLVHDGGHKWRVMHLIFHVLLAVNMSFNFALYCVVNSQFRKTIPVLYCVVNNRLRKISQRVCSFCCKIHEQKTLYTLQSVTETKETRYIHSLNEVPA